MPLSVTDIDECQIGTYQCDDNAACENIDGGYNCNCNPGFFGNGTECNGNDLEVPWQLVCVY